MEYILKCQCYSLVLLFFLGSLKQTYGIRMFLIIYSCTLCCWFFFFSSTPLKQKRSKLVCILVQILGEIIACDFIDLSIAKQNFWCADRFLKGKWRDFKARFQTKPDRTLARQSFWNWHLSFITKPAFHEIRYFLFGSCWDKKFAD